MNDLSIILRSLKARLFSTIVTVLTVAIAVGLLMALLMLRTSGERAFSRGTGNAQLLVSRDASPLESVLNGLFYANAPRNSISMVVMGVIVVVSTMVVIAMVVTVTASMRFAFQTIFRMKHP